MGVAPYFLALGEPLPSGRRTDVVPVDPNVTALRWSHTLPGGFNGCTVGLRWDDQPSYVGELGEPITVRGLGDLRIYKRSELGPCLFRGRVTQDNRPGGREVTALTAVGLGIHAVKDLWFHSPDTTSLISGGQLVYEMVTQSAPLLRIPGQADFSDPLGQFTRAEQNGHYPGQAIDQVVKAGSDIDLRLLYAVYEDRYVQLLPLACPLDGFGNPEPHYVIPFDRDTVNWGNDYDNLIGACEVAYTPAGGSEQVTDVITDPSFAPSYGGLMRGAHIVQSSMQREEAEKFRNRHLALYSQPVVTVTIVRDESHPLLNRFGRAMDLDDARAGDWIQVGSERPLPIIKLDRDASSPGQGKLTLELSSVGGA